MDNPSPPRLISWNVTLRCPLQCSHCYIDAGEREVADPLTTEEAYRVLDEIRKTGTPLVILSGGEPMMREDICDIAAHGTKTGLRMGLGTSGMGITQERAEALVMSGIRTVAISLDSADSHLHDTYRGYPGAWNQAVSAIRICREKGMQVQINMTLLAPESTRIDEVVSLGITLGVRDYQIFVPVPTGRSRQENYDRFGSYEKVLQHMLTAYQDTGISLRPTCIPQFRRIAEEMGLKNPGWGRGCIAGISYCRIYANGLVTPCPYLPVIAGDLRKEKFADIWYHSEVFHALRDPKRLQGKCGRCEYNLVCGGCRARAYSAYGTPHSCGSLVRPADVQGDLCGEDPLCPYIPGGAQ
ncbi:MAG: radical SAM protein [Methanospirillaceae archaeon]|nr:radical SAM protein [Methanospirillaceae archaeon]